MCLQSEGQREGEGLDAGATEEFIPTDRTGSREATSWGWGGKGRILLRRESPGLGGVVLTGDCHGAIEAGTAVHALEVRLTQVVLELVLLTATHGVLVSSARRNLHLEHF